ncbi:hypothetical protein SAMN05428945_4885 [Streptomyces sp. 2224.1]|nr:hypothetical protein SAMN05428945_4885 [Streptomyces sp. 2224.1]
MTGPAGRRTGAADWSRRIGVGGATADSAKAVRHALSGPSGPPD